MTEITGCKLTVSRTYVREELGYDRWKLTTWTHSHVILHDVTTLKHQHLR